MNNKIITKERQRRSFVIKPQRIFWSYESIIALVVNVKRRVAGGVVEGEACVAGVT